MLENENGELPLIDGIRTQIEDFMAEEQITGIAAASAVSKIMELIESTLSKISLHLQRKMSSDMQIQYDANARALITIHAMFGQLCMYRENTIEVKVDEGVEIPSDLPDSIKEILSKANANRAENQTTGQYL